MSPEIFEALREHAPIDGRGREATDSDAHAFRDRIVRFLRNLDDDHLSIPVLDLIDVLDSGE